MTGLFDLHCDTPTVCLRQGIGLQDDKTAVSLKKAEQIEKWVQTCAVFIPDNLPDPYGHYRAVLAHFKSRATLPFDDLAKPKTLLLSVEGGRLLEGKPDRVEELRRDGILTMSLTWNGENELAGGAGSMAGLKKTGRAVVRRMNECRMACDLSHLNDRSFYDTVQLADYPLATHSNSRAVCCHRRNLTDDQLCVLRDKKGLVGLCFYPLFLGKGNPFRSLFRHICHMLDLGLEDNLAIGSDFDGADMDERLNGTDKIPSLYDYLYKMGIDSSLLDKIFYQNAMRFYQKLFDNRIGML